MPALWGAVEAERPSWREANILLAVLRPTREQSAVEVMAVQQAEDGEYTMKKTTKKPAKNPPEAVNGEIVTPDSCISCLNIDPVAVSGF